MKVQKEAGCRRSSGDEKIKLADIAAKIAPESFFDRGTADDDCGESVNLALCIPCIDVLAAKGKYPDEMESALEGLAKLSRSKAIIVNATCADIPTGTEFAGITKQIESRYGIPVKIFEQGPLFAKRTFPKMGLCDIFIDLLQRGVRKEAKRYINVLGKVGKLPEDVGLRQILNNYCSSDDIREFAALNTYEEFEDLANGKLNIALDRFGYEMAVRMREQWKMPFLYLPARYSMKEIMYNYAALLEGLHVTWNFSKDTKAYCRVARQAAFELDGKRIAVGIGPRSFELAHALELICLPVAVIFAETVTKKDMKYIESLSVMESQAEVYFVSNVSVERQRERFEGIDIAIGEKASFYCATAKKLLVSSDYRFGYEGIIEILESML